VQAEVDRFPSRQVAADYTGPATVEAYTVMHGHDGPEIALLTALTPDGRRVLGANRDPSTMASFMEDEPIGRPADVGPEALIEV
jgi:acetyl-CoA C-acetyltransferase